jgi:hypothetical protein
MKAFPGHLSTTSSLWRRVSIEPAHTSAGIDSHIAASHG